jgi:serine/threonine-protein kinase
MSSVNTGNHPENGAARFQPGSIVGGKYRVERELASGGVGVIVLATHLELGQKVAIKYLHAQLLTNRGIVERFKREARLAASIRSDHVVRIHDVGTLEDGAPYIVMEYLEGEDLGAILARGPVPVERAVDWVLQACEALAEAHALGIVHRDLKPENLFLARRSGGAGVVKVVDFGISKVAANSAGPRLAKMTEEDERFGTPLYMSPEQLMSSTNVDARSDIWALGIVLYELLTADVPFQGDDLPTVISNVLASTPTPLRFKLPDASPVLEAVILSCLSRDPAFRPSSLAELAQALRPFGPTPSADRSRDVPTAPELVIMTPAVAWVPARITAPVELPERPARILRGIVVASLIGAMGTATITIGFARARYAETRFAATGLVAPASPPVSSPPPIVLPAPLEAPSSVTSIATPPIATPPIAASTATPPASAFRAVTSAPVTTARTHAPAAPAPAARHDYNEFGGRQ